MNINKGICLIAKLLVFNPLLFICKTISFLNVPTVRPYNQRFNLDMTACYYLINFSNVAVH